MANPGLTPSQVADILDPQVRVVRYLCGDGKTFWSEEIKPDMVKRISGQLQFRHQGIRSMEVEIMKRSQYQQILNKGAHQVVLEIGVDYSGDIK